MAEGRFLSRSIAQSYDLAAVSFEAAFLFTWCIPHLDRDGRMPGDAVLVKSLVCPLRTELDVDDIDRLLDELADVGVVEWYQAGRRRVLQFPAFSDHQKGLRYEREAESRFPSPDDQKCRPVTPQPPPADDSGPTPDEVRENGGVDPATSPQGRGRPPATSRRKGSEVKGSEVKASAARAREPDGLDELRTLLGGRAGLADTAAETITGSTTWPRGIVGLYGPNGTRREALRGLENGEVETVLAESVAVLMGEGGRWRQPFFDAIVKRVAKEYRESGDELAGMSDADRRAILHRRAMEEWNLAGSEA